MRVECIERVDHRIDNWNEYVVVVVGCGCSRKTEDEDGDANEVIFHTFQTKSAVDKLERGSVSRTNIHRDNIIAMGVSFSV